MACDVKYKLFRPCKWEAQYDYEGAPTDLIRLAKELIDSHEYDSDVGYTDEAISERLAMAQLLVEKLPFIKTTSTYVGSVCKTCGKMIKRDDVNT